ncbi:hypothetical protein Mal15_62990 [Stieleria maiorica]|uniref:Uncharacterized protein n=1 Tax=Stieleria maiorica TaxID=2795974 RepID=A0A5B9MMP1_9BACT|nr:hypothetical protein [Stieleria maiorica]QEG02214.1 hypothetical protein Mal15_62990 [Stieleria maiorica]
MLEPKLRRYSILVAAGATCALAIGIVSLTPPITAQDALTLDAAEQIIIRPRVETSYREVVEDGVTRRIPETHVRYERTIRRHSDVSGMPAGQIRPLPHTREIGPLVQRIAAAKPDDETEELKEELRGMLDDQFEAMSAEQHEQIEQISKRLEQLKSQHQARAEAREEIIRRRMNELLRQPDPLAWDTNANRRRGGDVHTDVTVRTMPSPSLPAVPVRPQLPANHDDDWRPDPNRDQWERPQLNPPGRPADLGRPASLGRAAELDRASTFGIAPARIASDPRADHYLDARLAGAAHGLYSAIGRHAVDRSEESERNLRDAIKNAQRMIATVARRDDSNVRNTPLIRAIESAASQLMGSDADLEEDDESVLGDDRRQDRPDSDDDERRDSE